jgi:F0F1-type ATP synthase epsilon subunit
MKFKTIVVSSKNKLEIETEFLTLPTQEGELTILALHAPIIGKLKEGEIITSPERIKIKGGFFEFLDNFAKVVVFE